MVICFAGLNYYTFSCWWAQSISHTYLHHECTLVQTGVRHWPVTGGITTFSYTQQFQVQTFSPRKQQTQDRWWRRNMPPCGESEYILFVCLLVGSIFCLYLHLGLSIISSEFILFVYMFIFSSNSIFVCLFIRSSDVILYIFLNLITAYGITQRTITI